MATIKDVARRAGVSVPTVSRVLNNHPYVTSELALRVSDAIAELNYRPSRVARRLRSTSHRLFGAIFSDITNAFYINVLRGLEEVLSKDGMSLLISNAASDPEREAELIQLMRAEDVAGLVIAPTREDSPVLAKAVADGLPVVVIDRHMRDFDVDTIIADNYSAAMHAVSHLIDLGNQRIGVISGPPHLSGARDRHAGYLQAMSNAGLPVDPDLTCFGDFREASGYDLARRLIHAEEPPTAIFVSNNEMTIGALNAIHESGRVIPDDIAIVGFDDFPWAISLNPPLSTVAQPTFEMGTRAAALLLERIADPEKATETIVLDTELKVRASCGAAKNEVYRFSEQTAHQPRKE